MDMINRPVHHAKFGEGIIKSCENGTMQVYFTQYGARFFHYPEAFDKFLKTGDEALNIQVQADLNIWRARRAAENERVAAAVEATISAARPLRKPAVRKRTPAKTAAKD